MCVFPAAFSHNTQGFSVLSLILYLLNREFTRKFSLFKYRQQFSNNTQHKTAPGTTSHRIELYYYHRNAAILYYTRTSSCVYIKRKERENKKKCVEYFRFVCCCLQQKKMTWEKKIRNDRSLPFVHNVRSRYYYGFWSTTHWVWCHRHFDWF